MDKMDRSWRISLDLTVELVPGGDGLLIQIKNEKEQVLASVPVPWNLLEDLRVQGAWGPGPRRP